MKRFISQLRWPLAIGRALRHPDEGEQSESDSRARHDRAFLYLSRCALRSRDGASVLGDICRITARALRVDHVHIAELLPDGRTLIARAASGWAPERLALWRFDLAAESRLGQAVHNSALIVLDGADPGGLAGGNELLRDLHMRSGLVTGVSAAPGTYALFGVYSIEPRRFTREELQFVRGVGHIVESTLERCVRAVADKTARMAAQAEQADLLRIVVGKLRPALRDCISPLTRLRSSPPDTFTFRRAVRQTERQVATVAEFIEELQLLANLLDGWRPTHRTVLVAPLLGSIVEQLGDRAKADSGITLNLRIGDDCLASRGDPTLIRRALFNLVDNALRFTDAGGVVTISLMARDASTVAVEVRDTGRGMTSTQVDRLLNKREGALRSEHRGAGVGWRLAAAILEAHEGSLSLTSGGSDKGTTVTAHFPRLDPGQTTFTPV